MWQWMFWDLPKGLFWLKYNNIVYWHVHSAHIIKSAVSNLYCHITFLLNKRLHSFHVAPNHGNMQRCPLVYAVFHIWVTEAPFLEEKGDRHSRFIAEVKKQITELTFDQSSTFHFFQVSLFTPPLFININIFSLSYYRCMTIWLDLRTGQLIVHSKLKD